MGSSPSAPETAPARVPVNQPWLFQWLRAHMLRNGIHGMLRGAWVRLFGILLCSMLVWIGVFAGSVHGFHFLSDQKIPFAGSIVGTLFDFLFLALMVMLVFSSGIILYGSLFTSAECVFLLSTPARSDQVFAYKYQGAIAFSSWAFLLLGSPILIAYGLVYDVTWHFYALLPLYFLGFVLVPGSLGGLICLLVVNYLPRKRMHFIILGAAMVLGLTMLALAQLSMAARSQIWNRDLLQRLVGQFAFAQGPLVPSHWMARGLQAAARNDMPAALYHLALIWSNGLFLYVVTAWTAKRLYRSGFNCLATGGELRRKYGGAWLDALLTMTVSFLDPQTRLLIVKDFRTFRRDPAQWAQVLIITGLLTFYSVNTRRFYQEELGSAYQNGVSFLNLMATALLLCAYTGRFIYPMLSLEGRKFWILGLLPLRRERLLWGKFAFSAVGGVLIAEFLVLLSDTMLGMPGRLIGLHSLTVAVLAMGLSGLSVGLGAWMPNFRESDPSKIAVGFGGTLNLVAGLLFLVLILALMAMPSHLVLATGLDHTSDLPEAAKLLNLGIALGVALGIAAVVFPLRIGARTLRQMEF